MNLSCGRIWGHFVAYSIIYCKYAIWLGRNEALDPTVSQLPELITGFCSMKQLGVLLLPLAGMLVQPRPFSYNLLGFPNNLPVPIYTPGWREAL